MRAELKRAGGLENRIAGTPLALARQDIGVGGAHEVALLHVGCLLLQHLVQLPLLCWTCRQTPTASG